MLHDKNVNFKSMRLIYTHTEFLNNWGVLGGAGRRDYDKLTMVANYIKALLQRKEDLLAFTCSKTVTFSAHTPPKASLFYSAVKMTKK